MVTDGLSFAAMLSIALVVGLVQGYFGGLSIVKQPFELVCAPVLMIVGFCLRGTTAGTVLELSGATLFVIFICTIARGYGWIKTHPEEAKRLEEEERQAAER